MTKRNLCDTCLHRHVCRHSTDPAGTAMVSCVHYEHLLEIGYTLGRELIRRQRELCACMRG